MTTYRGPKVPPPPIKPRISNPDIGRVPEDPILDTSDRREPRESTIFTISGNNEQAVIPIIYGGPVRTGGILVFGAPHSAGDYTVLGSLVIVYVICWGPVDSITDITFGNDEPFSTFGVSVEVFTGTGNTVPTPFSAYPVVDNRWTSSLPGIAYVVATFPNRFYNEYPDVDPYSFKCTVNGALVRDPRASFNPVFSKNVALCRADFWTNRRYAAQRPDSSVDWDTVIEAANDCDYDIGDGKPRFQFALKIDDPQKFREWDKVIKRHAQMFDGFNAGKYQMFVDKQRSDSGVILTDAGSDSQIIEARFRLKDTTEVPNEVAFTYTDTANGFKSDQAKTQHPGIGTGDINEVISTTFDTKGCIDFDQAKRLSVWGFNRAQLSDKEYTISVLYDGGIRCVPGLRIKVTSSDFDWNLQDCIVTKVSRQGYGFLLNVEKYDENIYSDTPQTNPSVTPPVGPSPYAAVPDPEDMAVTEFRDSVLRAYVKVEWTRPSAYIFYDRVRVTVTRTKSGETTRTWIEQEAKDGPILIGHEADGATYTIKLQTISTRGVLSTGVTADITIRQYAVPNPVEVVLDRDTGVYFSAPPIKTDDLFGSSYWSKSGGITGFDASKVNDGNTSVSAATWPLAETCYIKYDAGVGNTKEFRELTINGSLTTTAYDLFVVEYSDDDSSWFSASATGQRYVAADEHTAGVITKFTIEFEDLGAHRYWRFGTMEIVPGSYIAEAQFREWSAANDPNVVGYKLYHPVTNKLLIEVKALPTVSSPLDTGTLLRQGSGASDWIDFVLRSVYVDGRESEGIDVWTLAYKVPPNPIAATAEIASGPLGTMYWTAPPAKVVEQFGSSMWSGPDLPFLDATKVNDGSITADAVSFTGLSLDELLILDLGASNDKEFREIDIRTTNDALGTMTSFSLWYSDNGADWTAITVARSYIWGDTPFASPIEFTRITAEFASVGSHRYWRLRVAGNVTFSEIQWIHYKTVSYPSVKSYRVYSTAGKLLTEIPHVPTSSAPLDITQLITRVTTRYRLNAILKTVNYADRESSGIEVSAAQLSAGYATQLVERGATETLTGKTMSAASNTFTGFSSGMLTDYTNLPKLDAASNTFTGVMGIGGTPSYNLDVHGATSTIRINTNGGTFAQLLFAEDSTLKWNIYNDYNNDFLSFGNSGGNRMVLSPDGDLVTTNSMQTSKFYTSGGTVSVTNNTATTLFDVGDLLGRVEIFVCIVDGGVTNYSAIATVIGDSSGVRIVANNGALLTLSLSGTNVQVTQTSGSTQNVYYRYINL